MASTRKINWHRQHRWSGIAAAVLMLVFCISGVILNHRNLVADYDVSRRWLPEAYGFKKWNSGLMRGTVSHQGNVYIYGINGIWKTDSTASAVHDFNSGIPRAADHRQIRSVSIRDGILYAASTEGIYSHSGGSWRRIPLSMTEEDERISDMVSHGDSLLVLSRSNLYVSPRHNAPFTRVDLQDAADADGKVTLFRTVWMLHSGELFGITGKLVVDAVAIILAFLSFSGLAIWILPKCIKTGIRHSYSVKGMARILKYNILTHKKVGSITIILTILLVLTGWCLRPPVMLPLVLNKTKPMPGTTLDHDNPWHEKLRMIRHDDYSGEWLLSTADGFYALKRLEAAPVKIPAQPPVSVMGLNVWENERNGQWICGSFSGMFRWDRETGSVTDYFTGDTVQEAEGPPFGKYAVSGYSEEYGSVVEYYEGTDSIPQPEELRHLPMSLWNLALEAHSGRLFIGSIATYIFIFMTGLIIIWCLWSGWKARFHSGDGR